MITFDDTLKIIKTAKKLHELNQDPMLLASVDVVATLLKDTPCEPNKRQSAAIRYVERSKELKEAFYPYWAS